MGTWIDSSHDLVEPTIHPMAAHRNADAPRHRGQDNPTAVESGPWIQIDVRRSRRLRHAPKSYTVTAKYRKGTGLLNSRQKAGFPSAT